MATNAGRRLEAANLTPAAAIVGRRGRSVTEDDAPAIVHYLEDIDRALAMIPDGAVPTDSTARFDPAWPDEKR